MAYNPSLLRKIAITVAYDGTDFAGWQWQPNQRTVQGVLQQAWQQITGEDILPAGSGRTDAGVHAVGQVATFATNNITIPHERFFKALNAHLPRDVRVLHSREVSHDFDARRSAVARTYHYQFISAQEMDPQSRRTTLLVRQALTLSRLNQLAQLFVGQHDFSAFCSSHDSSVSKVRTIYSSVVFMQHHMYIFEIKGNAFLMNMVRSLMGTLLAYHDHPEGDQCIIQALKTGQRRLAGATASPCGLSLKKVDYPSGLF
jgi:tRNA pseudouridine38-40 synthase